MTVVKMKWDIDLAPLVGCVVDLETIDGTVREGRLTGFTMASIELNGDPVEWPKNIELNGDPLDRVEFVHIRRMNIHDGE